MSDKSKNKSRFLLIECSNCNNEQVIFNKPSQEIKCLVCDKTVANPTGGRGDIKTKIKEVLR